MSIKTKKNPKQISSKSIFHKICIRSINSMKSQYGVLENMHFKYNHIKGKKLRIIIFQIFNG